MEDKKYINIHTGSVDTKDGWDYEENGVNHNAVDDGDVVEIDVSSQKSNPNEEHIKKIKVEINHDL